jgi:hypothetical protein
MRSVQRSVQSGAADLDPRLEALLRRPLEELEWRTDLTWPPVANGAVTYSRPFLTIPYPPSWTAYEPLRTRRLPEDFRLLAIGIYSSPSATWLAEDELWDDRERQAAAQKQISVFANKYGFLGQVGMLRNADNEAITWGESFWYWTRELGIFRSLIALADSIRRANDGGELERRELDAQVGRIPNGRRLRLGSTELYLHREELSGRPLHVAIGDRLRSFVRERVDVSLSLLAIGRSIRFRPTSTLSAIYLDLAMEMVGSLGSRLRECDYCHRPYRAGRRDSRFCSATCRSSARHHKSKTGSTIRSRAPKRPA